MMRERVHTDDSSQPGRQQELISIKFISPSSEALKKDHVDTFHVTAKKLNLFFVYILPFSILRSKN